MARILIVDDEEAILKFVGTLLRRDGFEVVCAQGGAEAQDQIRCAPFDLMITDYMMEPMDGMELLKFAQQEVPQMPVVMFSGYATVDKAVEVVKAGAFDYMAKPVKVDALRDTVQRALQYHDVQSDGLALRLRQPPRYGLRGLVAESPAMREVCGVIQRVAPTDSPVLILGPAGAGKELVARTIHENGSRRGGPFVPIDCSIRPESLLKTLLFGVDNSVRERDASRMGMIQKTGSGTMYLDEINALPLDLQNKIRHVLVDKTLPSAGGDPVEVDVRLVAASEVPLSEMTQRGQFNEDLHRRLSVFSITLPSLAQRREDVLGITGHLLRKFSGDHGTIPDFDADALLVLQYYDWPGNVDELETVVRDTYALASGATVTRDMLPSAVVSAVDLEAIRNQRTRMREKYKGQALRAYLVQKEKEYLRRVLASVNDDKEAAAQKLNMSPEALDHYLKSTDG